MLVVAKPVDELRPIDLAINGLKHPLLEVLGYLGALRLRTDVTPTLSAPAPSQGLQRPKMGPRVV